MAILKCDFCSAHPVWDYPAESFSSEAMPGTASDGGWTACEICSAMIEAGEWSNLAIRSVDTLVKGGIEYTRDLLMRLVMGLHGEFVVHRTGARRRI